MVTIIKTVTKIVLLCPILAGVVLGVHGIYIASHSPLSLAATIAAHGGCPDEKCLGDLFLSISTPNTLHGIVEWMTIEAILSWFMPLAITGISLVISYKVWKYETP